MSASDADVGLVHDLTEVAPTLRRAADGIWYGEAASVSYPDDGHDACFGVEDTSFWFGHRNRSIQAVVEAFPPPGTLFDVGGGNGFVAAGLQRAGVDVVLVEPGPTGARNAIRRGLDRVICASTATTSFMPASLPAVGVFDVVEHIEDDAGFLRHLFELVAPNGRLYLTVPAHDALWSYEDVQALHQRRYSRQGLIRTVEAAGFRVDLASYFFAALPLPILLLRSLPTRLGWFDRPRPVDRMRAEHGSEGGFSVRAASALLEPEVWWLRSGRRIPVGASLILAASRPADGSVG